MKKNTMNSTNSPTPRTDSIISAIDMDAAFQDLCRQLERELTEKTNDVARLRELLKKVLFELEKVPFQTPKLTAFTAHRLAERYREQLNQLKNEPRHHTNA